MSDRAKSERAAEEEEVLLLGEEAETSLCRLSFRWGWSGRSDEGNSGDSVEDVWMFGIFFGKKVQAKVVSRSERYKGELKVDFDGLFGSMYPNAVSVWLAGRC